MTGGFLFFYNFTHRWDTLDQVIVFFADTFPYLVILGAFIFLLHHHEVLKSPNPLKEFSIKWKEILAVFLSSGIAWVLARVLKIFINTPRPFTTLPEVQALFNDSSYAFPSGHATFFAALAVLIFFHHKKAGVVFMLCALLISVARVVAGVHFPIDILGGFALGILIAIFPKKSIKSE